MKKFKAIVSIIGTPSLKKGGVYDYSEFSDDDKKSIDAYLKAGHIEVIETKRRRKRTKKVDD